MNSSEKTINPITKLYVDSIMNEFVKLTTAMYIFETYDSLTPKAIVKALDGKVPKKFLQYVYENPAEKELFLQKACFSIFTLSNIMHSIKDEALQYASQLDESSTINTTTATNVINDLLAYRPSYKEE